MLYYHTYKYDFNINRYNRLIYTAEKTYYQAKTDLSGNGINE